jgi:hypothetical protein
MTGTDSAIALNFDVSVSVESFVVMMIALAFGVGLGFLISRWPR